MNIFMGFLLVSLGVAIGIGLMCLLFVCRKADDSMEMQQIELNKPRKHKVFLWKQ